MKIKFKDGKEINFIKVGNKLLAESVIWEDTDIHHSLDELRKLKRKVSRWFKKNAPEEIYDKFNVRLPLSKEILPLSLKDQIAYSEGRTDEIIDYFLGDEDIAHPIRCIMRRPDKASYGRACGNVFQCVWPDPSAVRLLLEEK